MPLSVNFTAVQSASTTSEVTLSDTSTGSDATIVNRRVYFILPNGNYLTTSGVSTTAAYENWSYSDANISLSVLPKSQSPAVKVEWWSATAKVDEKTINCCFDFDDYVFALGLTMMQVVDNTITQDRNWYLNKMKLIVNDQDAETAITYFNNTTVSQSSLDKNFFMIQNQTAFWGG